jgi:hypothetical protein
MITSGEARLKSCDQLQDSSTLLCIDIPMTAFTQNLFNHAGYLGNIKTLVYETQKIMLFFEEDVLFPSSVSVECTSNRYSYGGLYDGHVMNFKLNK